MVCKYYASPLLWTLYALSAAATEPLKVIYAVNCGGGHHIDKFGINYMEDPLKNIGIASDYGNTLPVIKRVSSPSDDVLYRTERYATTTFGYSIPIFEDGHYALILKFCEVYFDSPGMKVFDVQLNRKHIIVSELDIFKKVGRGTAHEEVVYFTLSNGRIYYKQESSEVRDNKVQLEFIKGPRDNPKINAFVLYKGDVSRIPRLPPLSQSPDADMALFDEQISAEITPHLTENELDQRFPHQKDSLALDSDENIADESDHIDEQTRRKYSSGPRQPDPYVGDQSSVLLPVFVVIGAFVPLLFCLCKL